VSGQVSNYSKKFQEQKIKRSVKQKIMLFFVLFRSEIAQQFHPEPVEGYPSTSLRIKIVKQFLTFS